MRRWGGDVPAVARSVRVRRSHGWTSSAAANRYPCKTLINTPLDSLEGAGVAADPLGLPEWSRLSSALDLLPDCLADLRSPLAQRFGRVGRVLTECEQSARVLVDALVERRDRLYPNPADWHPGGERYPQPEPILNLAVREWILSLGTERSVPLNRQKGMNAALTEILVARASVLTYSRRLHESASGPLVRMLGALWVLVAECWKMRPLLGSPDQEIE